LRFSLALRFRDSGRGLIECGRRLGGTNVRSPWDLGMRPRDFLAYEVTCEHFNAMDSELNKETPIDS
jgi:hypothetical protein